MSNELIFNILPFDPLIVPNQETRLPIDVNDLADRLREKLPDAKLEINRTEAYSNITAYMDTEKYGRRIISVFNANNSHFSVYGWPKYISRELIFWYRQYVPLDY